MTQFQKSIPINITGGSYESHSRPLSSQKTLNFYPAIEEQGKDQFVLHSWHGLKPIGSGVTGHDRGVTLMDGLGYRVAGETLYSFTEDGTHTELGTIDGTGRCTFANDGVNLVICANSVVYRYNGSLTRINDSNIQSATAVTYINNQFIYTVNGLFVVSDVGDPTTASGLNAAGAESNPDSLVRAFAYQQTLYMFGEKSIEPWWNTGVGSPPFSRIDGQMMEIGCVSKDTIAATDNACYFLGDDYSVYQMAGGQKKKISNSAMSYQIEKMLSISDANAYTLSFDGLNFYVLTFPSGNKTYALNESLGSKGWFELASGTNSGVYQGSSAVQMGNKVIVADRTNGKLYQLDKNTFTNDGETIQRQRVTSSINGKAFSKAGSRIQMSRLEILMEKGVGLLTGQGEDPKIQVEASYDGGRSWKQLGDARIGRLGEYVLKVEVFSLDSFYDCMFRITTSDPVAYEIYSGAIDARIAGW